MISVESVAPLLILVCLACWPVPGQEWRPTDLEKLVGQSADIAPSRISVPGRPQAGGKPAGKLDRADEVRRLAVGQAPRCQRPALKKVLWGLLWEKVRPVRRVAVVWTGAGQRRPKADEVVVTFFDAEAKGIPTWWTGEVLRQAEKPEVSRDGLAYLFTIPVDTFALVVSGAESRWRRCMTCPRCGPSCRTRGEGRTWRFSGGATNPRRLCTPAGALRRITAFSAECARWPAIGARR